jgi:gliding motility-associated-like protein
MSYGQTYFKALSNSEYYFNQKVERFSNGDILIGDSSLESLNNGGRDGKIFLYRIDNCGSIVWSYSYVLEEGYLELKDFKINSAGEIFAYGSFFRGLEELIFLLKIDGHTGLSSSYALYAPGTVDHFSYTLSIKEDIIMLYGLMFGFNTLKLGFVAIFDGGLNFQWGKNITPFASSGEAIITSDNGYLGWSGNYLIKLSSDGTQQWATELEGGMGLKVVSGPVETADGYILEANREGLSFFYKVDKQGGFLWKSEQFESSSYGAATTLLSDQQLLVTYNGSASIGNRLCQLLLMPDGRITGQRYLDIDDVMNTGKLSQTLSNNEKMITIAGNEDPFSTINTDIQDFIIQFPLDSLSASCLTWENFEATTPNTIALNFNNYDSDPISIDFTLTQRIETDTVTYAPNLVEYCEAPVSPDLLQRDTFLDCKEDWLVTLPGNDFVWSDNYPGFTRLISVPGTYKARKISCTNPIEVRYSLDKPSCGCVVYLPNAFSPNQDGINDELELFSDCDMLEIEMTIYGRWGEQLFRSRADQIFWDGRHKGKQLPQGIYLAVVQYSWEDVDGTMQAAEVVQEITLVR